MRIIDNTVFILCMNIVPVILIICSIIFKKKPPMEINGSYGFRTKLSMSSKEAWDYANKRIVSVWLCQGIVLLVLSVIATIVFLMIDTAINMHIIWGVAIVIEIATMILGAATVQSELKKNKYMN